MNNFLASVGKTLSKHSPTILTVGGVIGVGVTVVLACRATLKADEIAKESEKEIADYKDDCKDDPEHYPEVGSKEYTQELAQMYAKTALGFAKLYAVPAIIGVASVVSILGGHHILSKRNVQLTNSLAAMTTSYNELNKFMKTYRKRVKDDLGEEKDKEYAFGLKSDKATSKDADGKKVDLKGDLHTADGVDNPNVVEGVPYAYYFDNSFHEYRNSAPSNMSFLHSQEEYWNQVYKSRQNLSHADGKMHPVYINEILDSLGAPFRVNPRLGWNPCDPNDDGYIDFGYFNYKFPINKDFRNGFSAKCILEFNCLGDVSDAEGAPVPYDFLNK